jgi:hypothetical protein
MKSDSLSPPPHVAVMIAAELTLRSRALRLPPLPACAVNSVGLARVPTGGGGGGDGGAAAAFVVVIAVAGGGATGGTTTGIALLLLIIKQV